MSTTFSDRYGVDSDEPEWVENLRAEYGRKIANLQAENDRMIREENQEIARLEAEVDAWRQEANRLRALQEEGK